MSVFTKGLVVTGLGLAGVFMVLFLFYIAIRLLDRTGKNGREAQGE